MADRETTRHRGTGSRVTLLPRAAGSEAELYFGIADLSEHDMRRPYADREETYEPERDPLTF